MKCPICEDKIICRFKRNEHCHYDCRYNGHIFYIEFYNNEAGRISYKTNNIQFILKLPSKRIFIDEYDFRHGELYIDFDLSKSKLNQDNFYIDPDEFNYIKRKVATYLILQ